MFKKFKILLDNADKIVSMLTALYEFVQSMQSNLREFSDIVKSEKEKFKQLENFERFKNANDE